MSAISFNAICSWKSVDGLVGSKAGQLAGGLAGMLAATGGKGGAGGKGAVACCVGLVKAFNKSVSRSCENASCGVAVSDT